MGGKKHAHGEAEEQEGPCGEGWGEGVEKLSSKKAGSDRQEVFFSFLNSMRPPLLSGCSSLD